MRRNMPNQLPRRLLHPSLCFKLPSLRQRLREKRYPIMRENLPKWFLRVPPNPNLHRKMLQRHLRGQHLKKLSSILPPLTCPLRPPHQNVMCQQMRSRYVLLRRYQIMRIQLPCLRLLPAKLIKILRSKLRRHVRYLH